MTRASFLKVGGIITAALAASKALPGGVKTADGLLEPEIDRDLREAWHPSTCGMCPAGCGILYRMDDIQPVGIKGNLKDPVTRGALCLKAFGLLQEYAHPARLLEPRERNDKGGWTAVSWDSAIAKAGGWLKGARHPAVLIGHEASATTALVARFAGAVGADLYRSAWAPADLPLDALRQATGYPSAEPDFERTNFVVSFGNDWLVQYPHAALANQAYGFLRPRSGLGRGRMITVSSRYGLTALKSDQWIACNPGMEGAAALAVAGLLVRAGKARGAAREWGQKVLAGYTPEHLSRVSGVPMEKLRTLADELGHASAPLVLGTRGRLADQWAVTGLAALAGGLGRPGGIFPSAAPGFHDARLASAKSVEDLFERLRAGTSPVDLLVIHGANPAFASPDPSRWPGVLRRVPHIVAITPFIDETAGNAHLVLPSALMAEREDAVVARSASRARVRHTPAAIPPRPGVRPPADIVAEIARASGRSDGFPAPGDGVSRAINSLVRQPVPGPATGNQPAAGISPALASAPEWTMPTPVPSGEFRLRLLFSAAGSYGYGAHVPYLITATAPVIRTWWDTVAELNPESARKLGIADRDRVELASASGKITAMAKLFEGVPPGEVAVSFGLGRGPDGLLERGNGSNPADLVAFRREKGADSALWDQGSVRITRKGRA